MPEKKSVKDLGAKVATVGFLGVFLAFVVAFWAVWAPSNTSRWWLTAMLIFVISVLAAVIGYLVYEGEE